VLGSPTAQRAAENRAGAATIMKERAGLVHVVTWGTVTNEKAWEKDTRPTSAHIFVFKGYMSACLEILLFGVVSFCEGNPIIFRFLGSN
jgi:hypothetical protein